MAAQESTELTAKSAAQANSGSARSRKHLDSALLNRPLVIYLIAVRPYCDRVKIATVLAKNILAG